ncbi:MAG: FtsK/SpoIIIE domain-containing protein, partial [Nostocoides sp.]
MDLRLTVTRVGVDRADDVTVTASAGHTATDLLAGLLACLGAEGTALSCGGRVLPPDLPVGRPPLLDGASLSIAEVGRGPATRAAPRAALVLDVVSGPDCGQSLALTPGRHTIGRDGGSSLTIADPAISRRHVVIEVSPGGVRLTDAGATNAVVRAGCDPEGPLAPGDEFRLGDSRLRLRTTATRPLATTVAGDGTLVVHRSPRVPGAPAGVRFTLPRPPSPPSSPQVQWLALLLPIPVCAVLAVLWGPQLLAFALLGPLVGGGSTMAERRAGRKRYAAELAAHEAATAVVRTSADRALAAELAGRLRDHPDPAEVARAVRERNHRLWEAGADDPPVLRVGLGPRPSRVLVIDAGSAEPAAAELLPEAPVTIDLSVTPVLGIVGPPARTTAVTRCLLGQLATRHSPDDLAVRLLAAPITGSAPEDPERGEWAWVRWLPHLETISPQRHTDSGTATAGRRGRADEGATRRTVTVVPALDSSTRIQARAAVRAAAAGGRQSVIVLGSRAEDLPAECTAILEIGPDPARTVLSLPRERPCRGVVVDGTSVRWAQRLARQLAPLRDAGRPDGELPATVTLATTHPDLSGDDGDSRLRSRWADPPAGLAVVLGVGAAGPLVVDLVADGPHALVGGTTGAGKSELLRALVTGLAASYPPDAVTFLLIDYKGGAAFRDCARLPHTVGVVTDLDADLARRALVSLTAEIRRREECLAAVGATDLADHARLRGPDDDALPRLLIVVDEFKMLIEERPEFVDGVVRLAAIGRSLGVHLVLATQRPAGAITADIQANVSLRIALRVRDRQDSEGVIEAPDAALIPESLPGRALLSTGTGRLRAFQTTHLGAPLVGTDEALLVRRGLGPAPGARRVGEASGPTELARFVDLARAAASAERRPPPRSPWLPPLTDTISVAELDTRSPGIRLGLLDLPERQSQPVWTWSASRTGSLGVVGAPGSGRSTLVRTLVGQLGTSPTPVHAYVIDGGGGLALLARLPWVGAVVPTEDRVRLRRFVDRLREEVRQRTAVLAQRGLTTLEEWPAGDTTEAPPHLLLVVDGWDGLAEPAGGLGPDLETLSLVDDLRSLIESGGAAGLRAVLTGGRALLARGARLCAETVVLGRLTPTDAALAGLHLREAGSTEGVPGRGVRLPDGAALQIAHLGDEPSGAGQSLVIADLARPARHARLPHASVARPFAVGRLPDLVRAADLPAGSPFLLGLDPDGMPRGLDPEVDGRRYLLSGPRRSGRTCTLWLIARRCAAAGRPVVVVSAQPGGNRLTSDAGDV